MSNQNQGNSRGGSHEQHVKAGQQSHKNTGSGSSAASSRSGMDASSAGSVSRGGTSQQHAEAGRQSHKNAK